MGKQPVALPDKVSAMLAEDELWTEDETVATGTTQDSYPGFALRDDESDDDDNDDAQDFEAENNYREPPQDPFYSGRGMSHNLGTDERWDVTRDDWKNEEKSEHVIDESHLERADAGSAAVPSPHPTAACAGVAERATFGASAKASVSGPELSPPPPATCTSKVECASSGERAVVSWNCPEISPPPLDARADDAEHTPANSTRAPAPRHWRRYGTKPPGETRASAARARVEAELVGADANKPIQIHGLVAPRG